MRMRQIRRSEKEIDEMTTVIDREALKERFIATADRLVQAIP